MRFLSHAFIKRNRKQIPIFAMLIAVGGIICALMLTVTMTEAQSPANVTMSSYSMVITPNKIDNFAVMKVRIVNPADELILNTETGGEVMWTPGADAIDGVYRYEVVVLTYDPKADTGVLDGPSGEQLLRMSESFTVREGEIVVPLPEPTDQQSLWKDIINNTLYALAAFMDILVPSAEAADLIAEDISPEIRFDDTQDEDCTPGWDWRILAEGGSSDSDINNYFRIDGWQETATTCPGGAVTIMELKHDGGAGASDSINSMIVEANGDISLADSRVFIDKSATRVGIGTATPGFELDIHDTVPEIELFDETDSTIAHIQYNSPELAFEGNGQQDIVRIDATAPGSSMYIDSGGKTSFNFSGSNSVGDGASTQLTITALNSDGTKSSDTGFLMTNNRTPFSWFFRTFESSQGFAATKIGTGGTEFQLQNGTSNYQNVSLTMGNGASCNSSGQWLDASSREYKDNIEALTAEEAIETIKNLEPVKYSFKRDETKEKNVGFIAEDVPDIVATEDRRRLNSLEFVAVLTKVVQEQQKTIAELTEKLKELEREIKLRGTIASAEPVQ